MAGIGNYALLIALVASASTSEERADLARKIEQATGEQVQSVETVDLSKTAEVQNAPRRFKRPPPPTDAAGNRPAFVAEHRPPRYPPGAIMRRQQGEVVHVVTVEADGSVSRIEIASSSGHEALDAASEKALRESIFSPALENNLPVRATLEVPTAFKMN